MLDVRLDRDLPAPDLVARYVFGVGAYTEQLHDDQAWQRFRRIETAVTANHAAPGPRAAVLQTHSRDLVTRLGPVIASALLTITVVVVTLSVLHGAPAKLPGWALSSALLFSLGRAGLIVLGLAVLANLLLALAAGRLVTKVSPQGGVELDAAALLAESSSSDHATTAALLALNERIDIIERTQEGVVTSIAGTVKHVNDRLEVLTQALAESAHLSSPELSVGEPEPRPE